MVNQEMHTIPLDMTLKVKDDNLYWVNSDESVWITADLDLNAISTNNNNCSTTIATATIPCYWNPSDKICSTSSWSDYDERLYQLERKINTFSKKEKEINSQKGKNNNMVHLNNIFPNASFGPVSSDIACLSPKGIAIYAGDRWQAYDKESGNIIDVTPLNFNASNLIYNMPVGIDQIQVGDIIMHAKKPMFVLNIEDNDGKMRLKAIDIINAEEKVICPIKSIFGFDFYTKVICLVDMAGGFKADEKNPFGNLAPWLLISDGKMNDILPFLMMNGGQIDFNNPLVLMTLCNQNGNMNDMLPLLMMSGTINTNMLNAPKAE